MAAAEARARGQMITGEEEEEKENQETGKKKSSSSSLNPEAPMFFPRNPILLRNPNPQFLYYQNYPPPLPVILHTTNPTYYYSSPTLQQQQEALQVSEPSTEHHDHHQQQQQQQPADDDNDGLGRVVVASGRGEGRGAWRGYYGKRRQRRLFKKQQLQLRHGDEHDDDGDFVHCFKDLQRNDNNKQKHAVLPVTEFGNYTTVMIRNIPNRFTRKMLMDFLDDHCMEQNRQEAAAADASKKESDSVVSAYDFLYLPIDFKYGMNKGYAFVNFTDAGAVWRFYLSAHNKRWNVFQSNKICEIAYARVQGKEQLVKRFQEIYFPCDVAKEVEYLPVCFNPPRDGSGKVKNVKLTTVGKCTGYFSH